MSSQLTPAQRTAVSRIASLTLVNAMVFQEVASAYVRFPKNTRFSYIMPGPWQLVHQNILPGSHRANWGINMTIIRTNNCRPTKGGTERQMSSVVTSGGATPFIKIKAQPKGGVR